MTKGDCVKCFQTTKHNRRHCEECLEDMRYKRRVKSIRERCHPDNRWMFPEVFEEPENNTHVSGIPVTRVHIPASPRPTSNKHQNGTPNSSERVEPSLSLSR